MDDDAAVRQSLRKVLENAGYEVVLAAGMLEATGRFDPDRTDLLLLDLNLPGPSGWDVFECLTTRNPLVPVVIITGMPDQYATALAAGAGALFEKPVDVPVLLKAMQKLLAEPGDLRLKRLCGRLDDTRYGPPVPTLWRHERTKHARPLPGASNGASEAGTEQDAVMKTTINPPSKGSILLLTADSDLRQSLQAFLEARQYDVSTCANPDEADAFLEAAAGDILVVDADNQSGSLGWALDRWTEQHPKLRVIGVRAARTVPNLAPVDVWIEKPIRPPRLAGAAEILIAALRSEAFRDQLRQSQAAPLLVDAVPYRHWGLNE